MSLVFRAISFHRIGPRILTRLQVCREHMPQEPRPALSHDVVMRVFFAKTQRDLIAGSWQRMKPPLIFGRLGNDLRARIGVLESIRSTESCAIAVAESQRPSVNQLHRLVDDRACTVFPDRFELQAIASIASSVSRLARVAAARCTGASRAGEGQPSGADGLISPLSGSTEPRVFDRRSSPNKSSVFECRG